MRKNVIGLLALSVVIVVGLYAGFGMKSKAIEANNVQPAATETVDASPVMEATTYALGDPKAPIHIKEYASLSCSHCAEFSTGTFPQVKKELIDTGKVYFEFVNFPLNASAMDGALIALCLPEERYHQFISFLFEQQSKWAFDPDYQKILKQNAKLLGASDEKLDACLADEDKKKAIVAGMQEAKEKYHIESTPSFVINESETISGALPYSEFKNKIEAFMTKEKVAE